jgi:hypothetical protein
MQFDQRFRQWQSQAGSFVAAGERAIDLAERFERDQNLIG